MSAVPESAVSEPTPGTGAPEPAAAGQRRETPPAEPVRTRWERRTEIPLLSLAVLFGIAYAVPIMVTDPPRTVTVLCQLINWLVWAAFAGDYVVRLVLSRDRWAFVRRHPFALAAVLLPLLRPLQLLRLVSALLLVGERARMASQIRLTTYVAGCCGGLLMFGSLAVLEVERGVEGSTIETLGDAVWWAFVTMTTVGYGDTAPVTGMGKLLAVGLMLGGIALLGVVTANIAAWFIARFEREDRTTEELTSAVAELTAEVRTLRARIAEMSETSHSMAAADSGAGHGRGPAPPPPPAPRTG
ncbi:potassium channel family protein [Streptomyces sp. YIM 98790]|uniref:potassium channel family protein n=1 Tax=Streptomyces sp. YIM 98790 TaxID=2689077 RepID=UPI00140951BF|nr:potassium channel family protein [Streptomyces sp. YIM 98790]